MRGGKKLHLIEKKKKTFKGRKGAKNVDVLFSILEWAIYIKRVKLKSQRCRLHLGYIWHPGPVDHKSKVTFQMKQLIWAILLNRASFVVEIEQIVGYGDG